MTVTEANLKIGDRFRYSESSTVWEVDSIVDRGVVVKALGLRDAKNDFWMIVPGSHKHLAHVDHKIEKI